MRYIFYVALLTGSSVVASESKSQPANVVSCGLNYQECVWTKSNYARYYSVGPIYWCPAKTYGCKYGYLFQWWKK
jgi:hypothetical protein